MGKQKTYTATIDILVEGTRRKRKLVYKERGAPPGDEDAESLEISNGDSLEWTSNDGAFAIVFDKAGTPIPTESILTAKAGATVGGTVAGRIDTTYRYSVVVFKTGEKPIADDPQIIITARME